MKKAVKWLALYILLLAGNILPCTGIISMRFPKNYLSNVYLLFLSVCLILRYSLRVAGQVRLRTTMLYLSVMIFFLILLRAVKYSVFGSVSAAGRYAWYLYYIPMLCIPMNLFQVSLYVYAKNEEEQKRKWRWIAAVTAVLILFVLTNDLHGQIFRFRPGFQNWDSDYSYGWGFAVVTTWEYLLYTAAVAVLVAKCSITKVRYRAWLILLPFVIGLALILLLITGTMPKYGDNNFIEFPEALCFMAAAVLECCMQLGLIPTNESYRGLMQVSSFPVQITDRKGNVLFRSDTAKDLTSEQFTVPDNTRIAEHTVLRRTEIPGGYGFWQSDVTELDRLNAELADAKKRLSEEAELIRLQNELKEKRKTIEERTAVYDEIAGRTQRQSLAISRIAKKAAGTSDIAERDRCRKEITLLGAYIKRYANLMLLASENKSVTAGELGLSVAEMLRYLNLYGIPGELMNTASGDIPSEKALAVFEAFALLLEDNIASLNGVYANLCWQDGCMILKLTLENMKLCAPASVSENLAAAGVRMLFEYEDRNGYLGFPLSGEGAVR